MFTGIIEDVGIVRSIVYRGNVADITLVSPLIASDSNLGDSIAVDGVCLTVSSMAADSLSFSASSETLLRSTLGSLRIASSVNLERALKADGRLGGHFVYGHVDGLVSLVSMHHAHGHGTFTFSFPLALRPYFVLKGSVAVDGISLTIKDIDATTFSIAVVPHSLAHTTLAHKSVGSSCNVEVDVLARYLVSFYQQRLPTALDSSFLENLAGLSSHLKPL